MLEAAAHWLSDLPTTLAVIVSLLVGAGLSALGLLVVHPILPHGVRAVHNDMSGFNDSVRLRRQGCSSRGPNFKPIFPVWAPAQAKSVPFRVPEAAGRFGREGGTRSLTRHSSGRGFGPHVDHLALR
jgi:hypothetical protein